MTQLVPGQNISWPEARLTAYLDHADAEVAALILGPGYRARSDDDLVDRGRPARDGVEWLAGPPPGVTVDLTAVPDSVERMLCLATRRMGGAAAMPGVRLVATSGEVVAEFRPPEPAPGAVVLVEVYRREGGWRVRAVGQGYAGGLAQAAGVHGLTVPAAGPVPAAAGPDAVTTALRTSGMILEDASRSTASRRSTVGFAASALADELERIVGDPALRAGPAGDAARAAAQQRHDAMIEEAGANHARDLAQLTAEIDEFEATLPAPLARWDAPAWAAWTPPAELQRGMRLGELTLPEAPLFRLPLLLGLPLSRPLWVDAEGTSDQVATAILRTAAARLLAAMAPAGTLVSIVDLGGGRGTLGLPDRVLAGPPATDASAAADTVRELVDHLDLLTVAVSNGALDALDDRQRRDRLLLVADFPTGLDEDTLRRVVRLIEAGPPLGVQVMVTGSHSEGLDLPLLAFLRQLFLRIPSVPGGDLVDGFGQIEWTFLPDAGPAYPARLDGVLAELADHAR
ncbi:MAG TPA: TerD family protein [Kribbellaceae bacterium]|nr:TerD family protein [Kribbellaceae bacterium]